MRFAGLLLAISLAACASSGTSQAAGSRRVITEREIEATNARTAYEVIERLRREFLRGNTSTRLPTPNDSTYVPEPVYADVYMDDVPYGHLFTLRNIPASEVREIRFLSASEAQQKYGSGHPAGVIAVTTKR